MNVSVLVPFRGDGGHRDRVWRWVRDRWLHAYPGWQVVQGSCPDGPWVKATAVAAALSRADGDLLVVADADVWTDGLADAVDAVEAGAPWAVPHGKVHRLAEGATAAVMAGLDPGKVLGGLARNPYVGVEGGGLVVLPRAAYERVPLDPRFENWGQEDSAWGLALNTLAGKRWRGTRPLFHLWHPPEARLNPHVGNAASHALHVRYQYASRRRADMRTLIAEFA